MMLQRMTSQATHSPGWDWGLHPVRGLLAGTGDCSPGQVLGLGWDWGLQSPAIIDRDWALQSREKAVFSPEDRVKLTLIDSYSAHIWSDMLGSDQNLQDGLWISTLSTIQT